MTSRPALDELRTQAERLQREGDFEARLGLLYGEIPELEKRARGGQQDEAAIGLRDADLMVKERVGADDIAEVISAWTGIPAGRLLQGETEKLLSMESIIGSRLIGQADAVRGGLRRRAPLAGRARRPRPADRLVPLPRPHRRRQDRAGQVAGRLPLRRRARHGAHRHERVLRAARGGAAHRCAARATSGTRRAASSPRRCGAGPYSVVLLDEVEKAHPETFDILLQVLDDGRLTDGQGRTVDFRNVILVMTSNLGCQFLVDPTLDAGVARREAVHGRGAGQRSSPSSSTGSTRSSSSTRSPRPSSPTSSSSRSARWPPGWPTAGSPSR